MPDTAALRRFSASLAAFGLLAVAAPSALWARQTPPAPAASEGTVSLPRVGYRKRVLANGLTVYAVERHATPTVSVQVWYRVGSKDDPAGRGGFAHLFEHLLFKSTKNLPSETLDRLTEDVGGANNAYTADDVTVYQETIPSNYLEPILFAEADRMANLSVSAADFASERRVVQEEYRQRVDADPYGRLYYLLLPRRSFAVSPYGRPGIGSLADLQRATLADARAFYARHYRPDNATVVVVGDFDPSRLDAWIDRYFAPLAKPTGDPPRASGAEPPRTSGPKRYTEPAPNVPLPAVAATFLTPGTADPDAPALRVADVVLSRGESSRLYRSLVYTQRIASEAWSDASLNADAGLLQLGATAATGKSADALLRALLAELDRLKQSGPTPAELTKARNQLIADALRQRETNEGTASALGNAAVLLGDPERLNTDLARLASVTAADVQRVLAKYATPGNRVEVVYGRVLPPRPLRGNRLRGERQRSAGPCQPAALRLFASGEKAQSRRLTRCNGTLPLAAQAVPPGGGRRGEKQTLPPPAPPRSPSLPTPTERRLTNGLRVVVVPKAGTGLVSVVLAVAGAGGGADPAGKAGLANFTASLLTRGAGGKSAGQIAAAVEELGGGIGASAGWDGASVSLTVLKANLGAALPVLADVALRPTFAAEEVARLRSERLDEIAVEREEPGTLARYAAGRAVYGDAPYGHPLGGTASSVRRIARADAAAFHRARYAPGRATLVFGGDITADEATALAESAFGGWKAAGNVPKPVAAAKGVAPLAGKVVVIDKPDAGQAAVLVTRRALPRTSPDYYAVDLAADILGGGYSSRLNRVVRVQKGLAYGAGGGVAARREAGPLLTSAQTKNESAGEVASLLVSELKRLGAAPPSAAEVTTRKAALTGQYALGLETGGGLAGQAASLAALGVPLSDLSAYPARIRAVSAANVRAAAARYLPAQGASVVVVGDARRFLPDLRRRFAGTPVVVIPAARFDPDRADLRRR